MLLLILFTSLSGLTEAFLHPRRAFDPLDLNAGRRAFDPLKLNAGGALVHFPRILSSSSSSRLGVGATIEGDKVLVDEAGDDERDFSRELLEAVMNRKSSKVFEILLDESINDIVLDLDIQNESGQTPLICAVINGDFDIASALVEEGASLNIRDIKYGYSALYHATFLYRPKIVKLLVDHKADVNVCNKYGLTVLMRASMLGFDDVVGYLLDAGADVNTKSKQGQDTALILASSYNYHLVVEKLLNSNANVNARNRWGDTALICACEFGHIEVVRLLCSHPAIDLAAENIFGTTAVRYAGLYHYAEIESMLNERGAAEYV